jgi:hypothetical protein
MKHLEHYIGAVKGLLASSDLNMDDRDPSTDHAIDRVMYWESVMLGRMEPTLPRRLKSGCPKCGKDDGLRHFQHTELVRKSVEIKDGKILVDGLSEEVDGGGDHIGEIECMHCLYTFSVSDSQVEYG